MLDPIKDKDGIQPVSFAELLKVIFWGLLRSIREFFAFLWRNKFLLAGAMLAGGITGFGVYEMTPASYKLTLIVRHTELTGMTIGHMLENLDGLATTHSYSQLSQTLKSSEAVVDNIKSIKGKSITGEKLTADTSKLADEPFIIEVSVGSMAMPDTIQPLILNFFNHNEYLNKLKNDKIRLMTSNLEFINGELERLDSLKLVYNRFLSSSRNSPMFYNNAFNPAEIYKQSAEYYSEKTAIEEWLAQSRTPILSIDGSKPFAMPQSSGMVALMLIYALIFFFIANFLAGIREIPR